MLSNKKILDFIYSKYQTEFYCRSGASTQRQDSFNSMDRNRILKTVELLPVSATSVLDAGAGPGVLMNYFLFAPGYTNVTAIDKRVMLKMVEMSPLQDFRIMDVCDLKFESNSFELVVCTEVLEHLPTEKQFNEALQELRRVVSKTLLISLPFQEKIPLIADHYHTFDLSKIQKIFPNGQYTIVNHTNHDMKHIIIIESQL